MLGLRSPLGALAGLAIFLLAAPLIGAVGVPENSRRMAEPITPLEDSLPHDASKIALGEKLFGDPILSGKNGLSCSSCHDLSAGGTIGLMRTIGYNGKMHRFNAPTIFNVSKNYRLGWRGNFTSLEAQNDAVIVDPNLMASDWGSLLSKLSSSQTYNRSFLQIYGRRVKKEDVLDVLVSFEQSLITPNARFDRYLRGDAAALSDEEKKGYELFKGYGCTSCHQGANIGGNLFEKFGVFLSPDARQDPHAIGDTADDGDLGRLTITHDEDDRGVFRVPSLRNVAVTAPYFHDGRTQSLSEAVSLMSRIQLGQDADKDDVDAIVAFLKTLTGEYKGHALRATPQRVDQK